MRGFGRRTTGPASAVAQVAAPAVDPLVDAVSPVEPAVASSGIDREALVNAATEVWAVRPYADVTVADLAVAAGTTPEDVSAQFPDLRDLYADVYRSLQARLGDVIAARLTSSDPITMMRVGVDVFLELFSDPGVRQISLVEARNVLGYARWRAIGEEYGSLLVDAGLADAMDKGVIPEQPVTPLAHVVVGMLEAAAHYAATAPDRERAIAEVRGVLYAFLDGIVVRCDAPDEVL